MLLKKRVVRIAKELVPFIEYALEALPGAWLFPDRHGRMHTPHWKPEKILRTALRRAGIVTGYVHVCRRKGCGHQQEEKDRAERTCPNCRMKLCHARRAGRYGSMSCATRSAAC